MTITLKRRLPTPVVALAVVAVVAVVAALALSALLATTSGRSTSAVPVAIVNEDTIVQGRSPIAAGRELAAALIHPASGRLSLDWTLTDAKDAESGLADGTYDSVLTIPSDFSKSISSLSGDEPVRASVGLEGNAATSAAGVLVAGAVSTAAVDALGTQVTTTYLDNTLEAFSTIDENIAKADSSAGDLASGATKLADGQQQSATGAGRLASSLGTAASGASALASGARSLSSSTGSLADGTRSLSSGAASLASGADDVSSGAAAAASGASATAAGAQRLASSLDALGASCSAAGGAAAYCAQVRSAAAAASSLSAGATSSASGAAKVASGGAAIASSSGKLAGSAKQVASGAGTVASGAGTLASSAGSLATGVGQAASAAGSLASGATTLATSGAQVASGAASLHDALGKIGDAVPSTTAAQQKQLSDIASTPVALSTSTRHDAAEQWTVLPSGAVLVLWLVALLGGLLVARRRRLLTLAGAPARSRRVLGALALPAAGIGAVAGLAVWATGLCFGVGYASSGAFAVIAALGGAVAVVLAAGLAALWSKAGPAVVGALIVLQVASLGVLLPIQSAPAAFQVLRGVLPMPATAAALQQALAGGTTTSVPAVCVALAAWAVIGLAIGRAAVRRRTRTPRPHAVRSLLAPRRVPRLPVEG